MLKSGMAVKELIQKLRHPPSNRTVALLIEFAEGSVYQISPDMCRRSVAERGQESRVIDIETQFPVALITSNSKAVLT
jgi:hypothetical protein